MGRIGAFFIGGILGGALVWLYGRDVREYIDHKTRSTRARAAATLGAAANSLEAAKERIEGGVSKSGGPDQSSE